LGKAGPALRDALHQIIRNHTVIPYASGVLLDTSDALMVLDQDATNANNVFLLYAQRSLPKTPFGTEWNREHRWPNSYGLDDVEPAYSDLHNLHAEDATVNSERGNKYFDISNPADAGYRNPAHAEALQCTADSDSWEPPPSAKGDLARSLFYMAVRYTGDKTGEPALALTDQTGRINASAAYMGKLSTLLAWHKADPPDATEQVRNHKIYNIYQHNRNPFIDYPEWVDLIFAPPETNAPRLQIAKSADGLVITWKATNQTTYLEFTTNMASGWTDASLIATLTNDIFQVTWTNNPLTSRNSFFRLRVAP
jgi:endonuclease I